MTLQGAHDTARHAADRFGKPFQVYRLPAWPCEVYGCTALDLPSQAEIIATYPDASVVAVVQAPVEGQGSLFG